MSKQLEEEVAKAMEEARRQGKEGVRLILTQILASLNLLLMMVIKELRAF